MFAAMLICAFLFNPVSPARAQGMPVLATANALAENSSQKDSQTSTIDVRVDPRTELLCVAQTLGSATAKLGLLTRFDSPYKRDVLAYFDRYKAHPAVKLLDEMTGKGFSFDAPQGLMVHLSDPPELAMPKDGLRDYYARRAGGMSQLEELVKQLRAFAADTNFMTFYAAHRGTFEQMTASVKELLERADYINQVERYYGLRQNSYTIILAPLANGNFGPRVPAAEGKWNIYSINSAFDIRNGYPRFATEEQLIDLIWHEFSHSYVNPLTERNRERVDRTAKLYTPIANPMRQMAYSNWEASVNEHIVRAVTARLHALHKGAEAGEDFMLREMGIGFAYIEGLIKELSRYEAQRNRYTTFEDFYAELLKVFDDLSSRELGPEFFTRPFIGPLNAVGKDRASITLILPTAERNASAQEAIHKYVEQVKERFFKDARVLTDKEALAANLSDNDLLVYGTPEGNLFLKELIGKLPVRITGSEIRTGQTHSGDRLRFITVWPNPQNASRGMSIYTAQRAEDVAGIHSVFHGGTDYVVASGTDALESANYRTKRGQWSFPSK